MSEQYNHYINEHKSNVKKAFHYLREEGIVKLGECSYAQILDHDESKWGEAEYKAYDDYFYGDKTSEVKRNFDYAWLHHIHNNPHHWQYWLLAGDETGTVKPLEMPKNYIIEMLCDWMSFAFNAGDINEFFSWWNKHKDKITLHPKSREIVEGYVNDIYDRFK